MAYPSLLSPYRRGMVGLVILLGAGLSMLIWRFAAQQDAERVRVDFLSRAQTQAAVANQRLQAYQEMVHSLRDSFLGQNIVTRAEFATVAQSLLARHTGVQALQWVRIVPHSERPRLEEEVTTETGRPFVIRRRRESDNTLHPAEADSEYFVINYVEPMIGNEAVLGYDITTAPSASLLRAARDDRQFKVSQTFRLAQSGSELAEPGIVFILPHWRRDVPGSPVEGFIQGVFHVQTMLAQSHQLTANEALDTYYIDSDAASGRKEVLYANLGGVEPMRNSVEKMTPPPFDDPADFHATIRLGDREWLMVIRRNAAWARRNSTLQPGVILGAGLIITALLALFINSLLQRTTRIEQEVRERTRQLRESESRLQDIVDHSPAIIFLKDPDGRYLLCNQPFVRSCGRSYEEIVGRTDAELFPAPEAEIYRKNDATVLAAGQPFEFEETATGTEGIRVRIVQKFPLLDEQGRPYALCGVATDITDRKAAEEEKLNLERQLLESQKLESLGVLAGGIAHDFNNILTAILGNATLAGFDLPEGHRSAGYLQHIERAARRASDLCAQMLAYAGKASFVTAPVNLTALVRDTAALLEVSVGKRARLELAVAEDLPCVNGDITQLRQIVMNLVINAADAMVDRPDGVIKVSTFCRKLPEEFFKRAVQSPKLKAGRYVGLEVRDNGTGMPPEVLARIFEPFFTTKFSGRGLGLAAVLGIVQSHDGALFVESTAGHGTVFCLYLPATGDVAAPTTTPFPVHQTRDSLSGTVLIVDDEDAIRRVASEALSLLGAKPMEAANGSDALDLMRQHLGGINLVLLDLTMPGMNGEEVLRRLREIHPAIRVVIMSGYSQGETMQRCASLGVSGFLAKPFEIGALIDRLRPYLA
jgi:two-component system cell cycle sensor histidine kinase/response regulator CckA